MDADGIAALSGSDFYGKRVVGKRHAAFTLERRLDASAALHLGAGAASDVDNLLVFEITPLQAGAIAASEARTHCGVWSLECSITGRRRFAAATVAGAWRWLLAQRRRERHLYEIIRAGAPSRLYFDLEYDIASNVGVDGRALTQRVVHHAAWLLNADYGVCLGAQHFVVLDSTSATKFSQHVVAHIPLAAGAEAEGGSASGGGSAGSCGDAREALFANNHHVGRVVRRLARAMGAALDVAKKNGAGTSCFIDLGVYTRNRAFRTYLSSKRGRDAVLHPAENAHFAHDVASWRGEAEFFAASLVATFPAHDDVVLTHALLTADVYDRFDRIATIAAARTGAGSSGAQRVSAFGGAPAATLASPFPALESYFATVVLGDWGSGGGVVRSWRHLLAAPRSPPRSARGGRGDGSSSSSSSSGGGGGGAVRSPLPPRGRLVLNCAGNRYCERVEREHKSNNISFVIDLAKRWWHQTCLDPDCRGYRSPMRSLPATLALV